MISSLNVSPRFGAGRVYRLTDETGYWYTNFGITAPPDLYRRDETLEKPEEITGTDTAPAQGDYMVFETPPLLGEGFERRVYIINKSTFSHAASPYRYVGFKLLPDGDTDESWLKERRKSE